MAFARTSACEAKNFLYKVVAAATSKNNQPSVKQQNQVKQTLIKVCQFFYSPNIATPQQLTVLLVKKANHADFYSSNVIFFPIQFVSQGIKHPNKSIPIAIHELGHVYFNINIDTNNQRKGVAHPFYGLSELFADSFAVLYFNQADVMSTALAFVQINQKTKTNKQTNFAKKRNFLNRNFLHLQNKTLANTSAHHQFDKARYHLWKYYFSNAKYKNKTKQLCVLLSLFKQFLHQSNATKNFQHTNTLLANNLLIDFIDNQFDDLYKNLL